MSSSEALELYTLSNCGWGEGGGGRIERGLGGRGKRGGEVEGGNSGGLGFLGYFEGIEDCEVFIRCFFGGL